MTSVAGLFKAWVVRGWRRRLVGGEAASAHRDVVPVEDVADRPPFDAESRAELIHGCSGLVTAMSSLTWSALSCRARLSLGRSMGGGAGVVGSGSFLSKVSSASTYALV